MQPTTSWQDTAMGALTAAGMIAVWEWDAGQDALYVNDAFCILAGCSPGPYQQGWQTLRGFAHPEDLAALHAASENGLKPCGSGYTHSYRLLRPDGSVKRVKEYAAVTMDSGKLVRVSAALLDIGDDPDAAAEQQSGDSRDVSTAQFSGIGSWSLNLKDNQLFLDEDYGLLLGIGRTAKKGTLDEISRGFAAQVDLTQAREALQSHVRSPKGPLVFELRVRHEDGGTVWLQNTASVTKWDEEGKPLIYTGSAINIDAYRHGMDRRSTLLYTINQVVLNLLSAQPETYRQTLHDTMHLIADEAEADFISIRRNETDDEQPLCCIVHVWQSEDFRKRGAAFEDPLDLEKYAYLADSVRNRRTALLRTPDTADTEQALLTRLCVEAAVVVPVYISEVFWGIMSYGFAKGNLPPTDETAKMLQSVSNIIVSSIVRNESTEHLIAVREEALSHARAKSEFLSRMSHEIRTPMNAIIGMTAIARRANDWQKAIDCLDKIDISSAHLMEIINDVLDISKIDANKLEVRREPFNFERMLHKVQNETQIKMGEKRQEFDYDFDCTFDRLMYGDELRLSQVLMNLLSNACKFTPEGGAIRLKVRETPVGPSCSSLIIEVQDNGIGISPERQKRLFQSFEQGDGSITRRFGGTGLGLAISKRIVELMGGKIWLESEEGVGSRFIVSLDVEWGERIHGGVPQKLKRGLRALVVDDSTAALDYFKNILTGFSIRADTASSGRVALDMVCEEKRRLTPYDVILVDWNMPDMNGGETAKEIKRIMGPDVLIIMVTASDWTDINTQAGAYGIRHYLQKPVLPSVLYNSLLTLSEQVLEPKEPDVPRPVYPDWSQKRILLAEDIEINREIVMGMLDATHIAIETAADGLEAVQKVEANPGRYDLVVMDVQMPVLDGLSATRSIRALPNPDARQVPIIAMTADAFKENETECLEAGMNAYISKPIEERLMIDTLKKFL